MCIVTIIIGIDIDIKVDINGKVTMSFVTCSSPQGQTRAFKLKGSQLGCLGPLNGQNLLSNDREHLQIDAVELIKASPGASRCKALEEFALQSKHAGCQLTAAAGDLTHTEQKTGSMLQFNRQRLPVCAPYIEALEQAALTIPAQG